MINWNVVSRPKMTIFATVGGQFITLTATCLQHDARGPRRAGLSVPTHNVEKYLKSPGFYKCFTMLLFPTITRLVIYFKKFVENML